MKELGWKFAQFEKELLDAILVGHRLCSDLRDDGPWIGRSKLLLIYFCVYLWSPFFASVLILSRDGTDGSA
jgi:hypothetical protein